MKTLDINSNPNESCLLDAIEQFVRDWKTAARHKEDLALRIKEGLVKHGRSWSPLYELFSPMGLLPVEAQCNNVKRDSSYRISKTAAGRIDMYLPVMKRLALECKKKPAGCASFHRTECESLDTWNQVQNFFGNLQKAGMVSLRKDGGSVDVCPKSENLRFFDGQWAEEGMVYLVEKTMKRFAKEHGLPSSVFWNVKLSNKPPWNVVNMELDIVGKIGKRFYVFEVKTGSLLPIDQWFER